MTAHTMSGGQAVVEALRAEEVSHVFGLIGSATMELFDALYGANDMRFIGVHDERTGTHMADGYARASGRAGVMVAGQNGPGAANLITGLAQAKAAYSPVVALAGALASGHVYRDAFQEIDQQALFAPVTKKVWTAPSVDRVPELVREAFRVAMSHRRGPVQLNLPRDVLAAQHPIEPMQAPPAYRNMSVPGPDPTAISQAAELMVTAERPVIVVGGGIKNGPPKDRAAAAEAAMTLAETVNCPVVTSPGHGDAIPHDFRLNGGQMGPRGNVVASRQVQEADVVLALGTRLGFNSTFYSYDNVNPEAKIIHVEIEPTAIGRFFPVEVGVWSDAVAAAQALVVAVDDVRRQKNVTTLSEAWTEAFVADRLQYLEDRDTNAADAHPSQPSGVFKALRSVIPSDAIVTMDAGTLCLQAHDGLDYHHPGSLFTPLDFGLVGFSFACGLGAKLAQPDRPVVSLMGDGGFGMTTSELSTAVDNNINTVTVVLNNQCWGAEKAYQRDFFGGRYIGADVSSPPFDQLAELYGARGFRADRLADVAEAVEVALACDAPSVVDVAVDPDALYSFRRDSFQHRTE